MVLIKNDVLNELTWLSLRYLNKQEIFDKQEVSRSLSEWGRYEQDKKIQLQIHTVFIFKLLLHLIMYSIHSSM